MVKGKAKPIMAYKPVSLLDTRNVLFLSRDFKKSNMRSDETGKGKSTPNWKEFDDLDHEFKRESFVGREKDLKFLENSLNEVTSTRENHVVLVEGEPGMGRTTLVRLFLRQIRKKAICTFYGKGIPPSISPDHMIPELSPFREMVANLWGGMGDESEEAKERLEEKLEEEGFDNASLFNALLDLRVPETRPASMLPKNARRKLQIDLIVNRVNKVLFSLPFFN
jgi:hypothetical protein